MRAARNVGEGCGARATGARTGGRRVLQFLPLPPQSARRPCAAPRWCPQAPSSRRRQALRRRGASFSTRCTRQRLAAAGAAAVLRHAPSRRARVASPSAARALGRASGRAAGRRARPSCQPSLRRVRRHAQPRGGEGQWRRRRWRCQLRPRHPGGASDLGLALRRGRAIWRRRACRRRRPRWRRRQGRRWCSDSWRRMGLLLRVHHQSRIPRPLLPLRPPPCSGRDAAGSGRWWAPLADGHAWG